MVLMGSVTYFMVLTGSVFCFRLSSSFFCRCRSFSCFSSICLAISHRIYKTDNKGLLQECLSVEGQPPAYRRVQLDRADLCSKVIDSNVKSSFTSTRW